MGWYLKIVKDLYDLCLKFRLCYIKVGLFCKVIREIRFLFFEMKKNFKVKFFLKEI